MSKIDLSGPARIEDLSEDIFALAGEDVSLAEATNAYLAGLTGSDAKGLSYAELAEKIATIEASVPGVEDIRGRLKRVILLKVEQAPQIINRHVFDLTLEEMALLPDLDAALAAEIRRLLRNTEIEYAAQLNSFFSRTIPDALDFVSKMKAGSRPDLHDAWSATFPRVRDRVHARLKAEGFPEQIYSSDAESVGAGNRQVEVQSDVSAPLVSSDADTVQRSDARTLQLRPPFADFNQVRKVCEQATRLLVRQVPLNPEPTSPSARLNAVLQLVHQSVWASESKLPTVSTSARMAMVVCDGNAGASALSKENLLCRTGELTLNKGRRVPSVLLSMSSASKRARALAVVDAAARIDQRLRRPNDEAMEMAVASVLHSHAVDLLSGGKIGALLAEVVARQNLRVAADAERLFKTDSPALRAVVPALHDAIFDEPCQSVEEQHQRTYAVLSCAGLMQLPDSPSMGLGDIAVVASKPGRGMPEHAQWLVHNILWAESTTEAAPSLPTSLTGAALSDMATQLLGSFFGMELGTPLAPPANVTTWQQVIDYIEIIRHTGRQFIRGLNINGADERLDAELVLLLERLRGGYRLQGEVPASVAGSVRQGVSLGAPSEVIGQLSGNTTILSVPNVFQGTAASSMGAFGKLAPGMGVRQQDTLPTSFPGNTLSARTRDVIVRTIGGTANTTIAPPVEVATWQEVLEYVSRMQGDGLTVLRTRFFSSADDARYQAEADRLADELWRMVVSMTSEFTLRGDIPTALLPPARMNNDALVRALGADRVSLPSEMLQPQTFGASSVVAGQTNSESVQAAEITQGHFHRILQEELCAMNLGASLPGGTATIESLLPIFMRYEPRLAAPLQTADQVGVIMRELQESFAGYVDALTARPHRLLDTEVMRTQLNLVTARVEQRCLVYVQPVASNTPTFARVQAPEVTQAGFQTMVGEEIRATNIADFPGTTRPLIEGLAAQMANLSPKMTPLLRTPLRTREEIVAAVTQLREDFSVIGASVTASLQMLSRMQIVNQLLDQAADRIERRCIELLQSSGSSALTPSVTAVTTSTASEEDWRSALAEEMEAAVASTVPSMRGDPSNDAAGEARSLVDRLVPMFMMRQRNVDFPLRSTAEVDQLLVYLQQFFESTVEAFASTAVTSRYRDLLRVAFGTVVTRMRPRMLALVPSPGPRPSSRTLGVQPVAMNAAPAGPSIEHARWKALLVQPVKAMVQATADHLEEFKLAPCYADLEQVLGNIAQQIGSDLGAVKAPISSTEVLRPVLTKWQQQLQQDSLPRVGSLIGLPSAREICHSYRVALGSIRKAVHTELGGAPEVLSQADTLAVIDAAHKTVLTKQAFPGGRPELVPVLAAVEEARRRRPDAIASWADFDALVRTRFAELDAYESKVDAPYKPFANDMRCRWGSETVALYDHLVVHCTFPGASEALPIAQRWAEFKPDCLHTMQVNAYLNDRQSALRDQLLEAFKKVMGKVVAQNHSLLRTTGDVARYRAVLEDEIRQVKNAGLRGRLLTWFGQQWDELSGILGTSYALTAGVRSNGGKALIELVSAETFLADLPAAETIAWPDDYALGEGEARLINPNHVTKRLKSAIGEAAAAGVPTVEDELVLPLCIEFARAIRMANELATFAGPIRTVAGLRELLALYGGCVETTLAAMPIDRVAHAELQRHHPQVIAQARTHFTAFIHEWRAGVLAHMTVTAAPQTGDTTVADAGEIEADVTSVNEDLLPETIVTTGHVGTDIVEPARAPRVIRRRPALPIVSNDADFTAALKARGGTDAIVTGLMDLVRTVTENDALIGRMEAILRSAVPTGVTDVGVIRDRLLLVLRSFGRHALEARGVTNDIIPILEAVTTVSAFVALLPPPVIAPVVDPTIHGASGMLTFTEVRTDVGIVGTNEFPDAAATDDPIHVTHVTGVTDADPTGTAGLTTGFEVVITDHTATGAITEQEAVLVFQPDAKPFVLGPSGTNEASADITVLREPSDLLALLRSRHESSDADSHAGIVARVIRHVAAVSRNSMSPPVLDALYAAVEEAATDLLGGDAVDFGTLKTRLSGAMIAFTDTRPEADEMVDEVDAVLSAIGTPAEFLLLLERVRVEELSDQPVNVADEAPDTIVPSVPVIHLPPVPATQAPRTATFLDQALLTAGERQSALDDFEAQIRQLVASAEVRPQNERALKIVARVQNQLRTVASAAPQNAEVHAGAILRVTMLMELAQKILQDLIISPNGDAERE